MEKRLVALAEPDLYPLARESFKKNCGVTSDSGERMCGGGVRIREGGEGGIGVTVRDDGIVVPVKSISGIHLVVRDEAAMPQSECRQCRGGKRGCQLCHMKNRCNSDTIMQG